MVKQNFYFINRLFKIFMNVYHIKEMKMHELYNVKKKKKLNKKYVFDQYVC